MSARPVPKSRRVTPAARKLAVRGGKGPSASESAARLPRRILLIEVLDAPGSATSDAAARRRALEHAGCEVEAVVLGTSGSESDETPPPRTSTPERFARGTEALRQVLRSFAPERVLVASALPGGGPETERILGDTPRVWWPTGLAGPGLSKGRPRGSTLSLLGASSESQESGPTAALEWGVLDTPLGGRRRLPLWDGEYVLAPVPLDGRIGADVIRAFATAAEERDQLDLVVLGPPEPTLLEVARRLEIGTRVHFAGASPRPAEYAWAQSAAATVIAGPGPVASGVVLRALACGSPLVAVGEDGVGAIVRDWLAAGTAAPARAKDVLASLERVLEGGPVVEDLVSRGRVLAARHELDVVAARLVAALRLDDAMRRAA